MYGYLSKDDYGFESLLSSLYIISAFGNIWNMSRENDFAKIRFITKTEDINPPDR